MIEVIYEIPNLKSYLKAMLSQGGVIPAGDYHNKQ